MSFAVVKRHQLTMPPLKLAAILIVSIALQLSLRMVWPPLVYIDFPLVVIVYIALQREAWQALVVATLAGLIVDAQSGALIGAGGFSKTRKGERIRARRWRARSWTFSGARRGRGITT